MEKPSKLTIRIAICVAILIAVTKVFREITFYMSIPENISLVIGVIRGAIYIGLAIAWGYSIHYRVTQLQVKRYMICISSLMMIWIMIRTAKFNIVESVLVKRYFWYLYYLPILFIPVFVLLAAVSLGNPEEKKLPKWTSLLYIPSTIMLAFVITNDWHQRVFSFNTVPWDNDMYSYEICYWCILLWVLGCFLAAVSIMVYKCRVRYSRKYALVVMFPGILALLYSGIYVTGASWLMRIAGDMTIVYCLLLAIMLEGFIQCRLICSNTNYDSLFDYTSIRAIITNKKYQIVMASPRIEIPSEEVMRQTEKESVLLENGTRLSGAEFKGGHVVWLEDVSEIMEIIEELADNSEYLNIRKSMLKKEVDTRKEEQRLVEKNRLYNHVMNQMEKMLDFYELLVHQMENTNDPEEEKKLVAKLAVVCSYIKRRGNLIFLSEKNQKIDASEIRFALEEWSTNLQLCGVKCTMFFELRKSVSYSEISSLFDTFQKIILYSIDEVEYLLITVCEQEESPCIILNMSCRKSLSEFHDSCVDISDEEDGEWVIKVFPKKGDRYYV